MSSESEDQSSQGSVEEMEDRIVVKLWNKFTANGIVSPDEESQGESSELYKSSECIAHCCRDCTVCVGFFNMGTVWHSMLII